MLTPKSILYLLMRPKNFASEVSQKSYFVFNGCNPKTTPAPMFFDGSSSFFQLRNIPSNIIHIDIQF